MKRLLILLPLALLSSKAFTQVLDKDGDSVTCIKDKYLRRGAALIAAGERDSVLLKGAREEIRLLNRIITIDSLVISGYAAGDTLNDQLLDNKTAQVQNRDSKATDAATEASKLNRKLKAAKATNKVLIIGIAAAAVYFTTK